MNGQEAALPEETLQRLDTLEKRVLAASQMHWADRITLPEGYDPNPLIEELHTIYCEACKRSDTREALFLRARIIVLRGLVPPFCHASERAFAEAKWIFHDLRRITGDLIYEENARWCVNLARGYDYNEAIAAFKRNGVLNND